MIRGDIQTFSLPYLIQWLALTRRTGQLTITQDQHHLELYFADCEVAAATSSDIIPRATPNMASAVFASCLTLTRGDFVFNDAALPAEIGASNLHLSAQALLVEVRDQRDKSDAADEQSALEKRGEAAIESGTFTPDDEFRLQVLGHLLKEDFRLPRVVMLSVTAHQCTRTAAS